MMDTALTVRRPLSLSAMLQAPNASRYSGPNLDLFSATSANPHALTEAIATDLWPVALMV